MRKLLEPIPESILRGLDRVSPTWAEALRGGNLPISVYGSSMYGGVKYDGRLDLMRPACCIVGESTGFVHSYACHECSHYSANLVSLASRDYEMYLDGIRLLRNFVRHFEKEHMKIPVVEKVPMEVEQK